MTHKKLYKAAAVLSVIIIILMLILRNAQSEIFAVLSSSLGLVVFYTLLNYLFQTEKIKFGTSNLRLKYLFLGISIPLLIFAIDATTDLDGGFLKNSVRILLAIAVKLFLTTLRVNLLLSLLKKQIYLFLN